MRKVIIIFVILCASAIGQHGPHRKIFSSSAPVNCTNFPLTGILESKTQGVLSGNTTLNMTSVFTTHDIILVVGVNNNGSSTLNPTISDGNFQIWNPLVVTPNAAIWYARTGSFSGDAISVAWQLPSNNSITAVHISNTFIPSFTTGGNSGTYPVSQPPFANFVVNSSTFSPTYFGGSGQSWVFGGVVVPSTGTFLHSLVIAAIASNNGTSYNPPTWPGTNWSVIIQAGLPSASIIYSCSF